MNRLVALARGRGSDHLLTEGETGSFLDFVWDMGGVGAATVVAAQAR